MMNRPMVHTSATSTKTSTNTEHAVQKPSIPDGGTIVWDKRNPMLGQRA